MSEITIAGTLSIVIVYTPLCMWGYWYNKKR